MFSFNMNSEYEIKEQERKESIGSDIEKHFYHVTGKAHFDQASCDRMYVKPNGNALQNIFYLSNIIYHSGSQTMKSGRRKSVQLFNFFLHRFFSVCEMKWTNTAYLYVYGFIYPTFSSH